MTRRYKQTLLAMTMALMVAGPMANVARAGVRDALASVNAKVSLVQAIAAAEQHVNGKAAAAEFERKWQGDLYEVDVVNDGRVFEVRVDANTGAIISSFEKGVGRNGHDRGQSRRDR